MGFGSVGKDSCVEVDLGRRRFPSGIKYLYIVYDKLMLKLNVTAINLHSRAPRKTQGYQMYYALWWDSTSWQESLKILTSQKVKIYLGSLQIAFLIDYGKESRDSNSLLRRSDLFKS